VNGVLVEIRIYIQADPDDIAPRREAKRRVAATKIGMATVLRPLGVALAVSTARQIG